VSAMSHIVSEMPSKMEMGSIGSRIRRYSGSEASTRQHSGLRPAVAEGAEREWPIPDCVAKSLSRNDWYLNRLKRSHCPFGF
jgi:hypothetical protein